MASRRSAGRNNGKVAEEARASDRLKLDISVAYSFEIAPRPDGKNPPYRWGTLVDISERGLCFRAPDTFFVQRVISIFLKLSYQTSGIKMLGKVIWTATDWDGSSRVGVQFIGTLPADWRRLVGATEQSDSPRSR